MTLFLPMAVAVLGWSAQDADPPVTSDAIELTVAVDAEIDLEAYWEPCKESAYGRFESHEFLRDVAPDKEWEFYTAGDFEPLLPPGPVAVGDVWSIGREAALPFLRQLHPGATGKLHHEPSGTGGAYACLRAVNDQHAEIFLRAHAEFILDDGSFYCPAQFEGRLLLDRESGEVLYFRLHLPSRNTNVDINVLTPEIREQNRKAAEQGPQIVTGPNGEKFMIEVGMAFGEADIGWVPRMELVGGERPEVTWSRELDDEKARRLLRDQFYAPIDWLPFEAAVQRSRETGKPLHVVSLFGTFDDESC